MGYKSLLRSPKKEKQEVADALFPDSTNTNIVYSQEDFDSLDELTDGVEFPQHKIYNGQLHWDFMEEAVLEDEEVQNVEVRNNEQMIKREDVGLWEEDDEKMASLNLNLNYQQVLDAWSDRGSLWAHDYSLSIPSTNNAYFYVCILYTHTHIVPFHLHFLLNLYIFLITIFSMKFYTFILGFA